VRNAARLASLAEKVECKGRLRECAELVQPAATVLDIGCSSGWLAPHLLEKGIGRYTGVDVNLAPKYKDLPAGRISFIEGSALRLPLDDQSFEAACLFDVIEHLPKGTELVALKEACRILLPGGRLYFSTPHASVFHTPLDPGWYFGHRHYRRSTARRLLTSAGFHVEKLFVSGGFVECFEYLRHLFYRRVLYRETPPTMPLARRLIERSHRQDQPVGLTIFAVVRKTGKAGQADK
jgi:ubiquinone/menaquinone biosynthesis C-methylase UbiE